MSTNDGHRESELDTGCDENCYLESKRIKPSLLSKVRASSLRMCFTWILFLDILYSLKMMSLTCLPGVAVFIEDLFFQADSIPELRKNCPFSTGIGVRITLESLSAFHRNECPVWAGVHKTV